MIYSPNSYIIFTPYHCILIYRTNFLRSCSFSHIYWQGNIVTHTLARREKLSSTLLVLMKDVPFNYLSLVMVDLPTNHIMSLMDLFLKKK